jgi:hypothetical protein
MTIPVICDRCRVAGTAGTGDFSHFGDLLEFDPVEVRTRVNGWDPDAQRAFIALLATTGSKRRAAMAIGRNAFGIDQLLKRPDAASFRAAYDRAMAIAKQNGAMKLATGVADSAARNAQMTAPSRLRGHDPEDDDDTPDMDEDTKLELIENLFYKWLGKVEAERKARLAGQVVAADFYLRQVTFFEVTFDLMCSQFSQDAWAIMSSLRRGGERVTGIAATPMSQILDEKRRELWASTSEPPRPEHPPARYTLSKLNYSVASEHQALSDEDKELCPRDQQDAIRAMYEKEAEEQLAWEAKAQSVRGTDEH